MKEHVSKHNKDQLFFEMNLREYRNTSDFKGDTPWLYPTKKSFRPEASLKDAVEQVRGTNYDAKKNPFLDKFEEPNANAIVLVSDKSRTVYRNA